MKALVADDAKMIRTIIRRVLEALGVKDIVEAGDGAEAIAAFQPGMFDIVLTDWNMPNKDGLQLLKEIRAVDKSVPVYLITTEGQQSHVAEAIQAGVTDYILKPFQADVLSAKLEKHLPLRA